MSKGKIRREKLDLKLSSRKKELIEWMFEKPHKHLGSELRDVTFFEIDETWYYIYEFSSYPLPEEKKITLTGSLWTKQGLDEVNKILEKDWQIVIEGIISYPGRPSSKREHWIFPLLGRIEPLEGQENE